MTILIMVKKQLKLLFKNKLVIIAMISVPVVLTYLFSSSISNAAKPQLYVADLDESSYSSHFLQMLKNHDEITVITSSEKEIIEKVDNQSIAMGFIIDKDFEQALLSGSSLPVKIIKNFESGDSAILKQILNSELSTLKKVVTDSDYISKQINIKTDKLTSELLTNIKDSTNINIEDKSLMNVEDEQKDMTVRLLGFLVMFIWFVIIQGFRTLIDEKENNTYNRLLSTPVHYNKYLISKVIATYVFGGFHILAILLAGRYLLNVTVLNHILQVILVFAAYLFLLTGISLVFALFMKKHENYTVSFAIVIIVTGMLGGSFFSLETAPDYMITLSKFTPEAHVLQLLKSIIFDNKPFATQMIPLAALIVIAVIFLLVSAIIVNNNLYKKQTI